jgi:hypothetical protein
MNRLARSFIIWSLAIAGLAGFGLVTSCNIIGGSGGGSGNLKLLMTDAPTDDWAELSFHFLSASLHRQGSDTWEDFWQVTEATKETGKINLIDLSGINTILQAGPIKAGTYDRLKLVMNKSTLADSMTLIPMDGKQILPENITVVDPSGTGTIKVDFSSPIVVEADKPNLVGIDFDLAHPLSIVNLDGKVVIDLKVRHRILPRNLGSIQFARILGQITAATPNTDGTATFTIKSVQGDALIDFNANGNTIYTDVSAGTPVGGDFAGFQKYVGLADAGALVASNMQSNGSLYARRVWYSSDIDRLPQFTPEGLVRRVGDNWLSVQKKTTEAVATGDGHRRCDWNAETVFVDADTVWNFQGVDMGVKGTDGLRYVSRGFRVEVTYPADDTTSKVADLVNIQCAHTEGIVIEPTLENLTLGWFWHSKTMYYSTINDAVLGDHSFRWWFYAADSSFSKDAQGLIDSVAAARTAHLWVFAWAGLYWDKANTRWDIENLVLAPLKLHEFTKITTGYTADSGSIDVSTFNCWDWTTPEIMNIKLDTTGDLQTIVGSFIWKADTNVVTFTLPLPTDLWDDVLTTSANKVKIWVHPVKDGETYTWHAYSVIAYQFIPSTTAVR